MLLPLEASTRSGEKIGRFLSNLAHTPFVLDGRKYESVEGFYIGLKTSDQLLRTSLASLWGVAARRASPRSPSHFSYQGEVFEWGSAQHHAIIARAIQAKVAANPTAARIFASTHPRPITHSIPDRRGTGLSGKDFVRILTDLRDELLAEEV